MLFGWFAPKSPLGARDKAWVEVRMGWLADQFGTDRLLKAQVILPTEGYFPGVYEATPEAAREVMRRVGGYMGLETSEIQLQIIADDDMPGAAGQFAPGLIRIATSQLDNPESLVATLAHELAHEMLTSRKLLGNEPDREWVTDLLPVFLGLGVFSANATLRETHTRAGTASRWSIRKHGYLAAWMIGYALALFAWARGERSPPWAEHLRLDAVDALRRGLRYLNATEDSLFNPETRRYQMSGLSTSLLVDQLENGMPSARVAALWMLAERGESAAEAVDVVQECLSDRPAYIRAESARALGALGQAAQPAIPALLDTLSDSDAEVRAAAAFALGKLAVQPQEVIPRLLDCLEDPESSEVACAAALAIARYGHAAEAFLPAVLDAIRHAVMVSNYSVMDCCVQAVRALTAQPEAALHEVVESCDTEIRPQAVELLREHVVVDETSGPGAWFGRSYA